MEPTGQQPDNVKHLLLAWISTETWQESQEMLIAQKERLLSDEAIEALKAMIAEKSNDTENSEAIEQILGLHLAILAKARADSIEAAYRSLVEPSPLARALQPLPNELRAGIEAMIAANSLAELLQQLDQHPVLLTPEATAAIDALLNDLQRAGQEDAVKYIHERYETLKQAIEISRDPLNLALNALVNATSGTLRHVITQHPLLLEDETLQACDALVARAEQAGDTTFARRLRLRLEEVKRIRSEGKQQPSRTRSDNERGRDDVPVADELPRVKARDHSIALGGDHYGTITQINIEHQNVAFPPLHWLPPAAPSHPEGRKFIGRELVLQELRTALIAGDEVTISGTASAAMLHGMAGIGKTYLATQLAIEVQSYFPGGVLTVSLGIPKKKDVQPIPEEEAQPILRDLAAYAFNGQKDQFTKPLQPGHVAAWLQQAAPGRLLVIFDDVWELNTLLLLKRALPPAAGCIVTTRDANIAYMLGGKRKELGRLSDQDSLDLLENRLGCPGNMIYRPALQHLVEMLKGHALALEIIAARIKRPERIQEILDALDRKVGQARLDQLKLPGEETPMTSVKAALALSYDFMSEEEQRRFRQLGVFESEAPITVEAAAAIWNLQNDINAARQALSSLEDLAMLEHHGADYRLHSLLYDYAYALLEDEGELTAAKWSHAEYYRDLVRKKDAPGDYLLLDQHIQNLLAALAWAFEQEPVLFADLLDASKQFLRLRGQYGLLEQYLPRAVEITKATGDNGRRANMLQSLGDLAARLDRLSEAQDYYDQALPLYREVQARLGEANIYMSLGNLFLEQRSWGRARDCYERALALSIDIHYLSGQAYILIDLGRVRFHLGDREQGIRDVRQAAALFQQLHDDVWARRARLYLARMHARLSLPAEKSEEDAGVDEDALLNAFLAVRSSQDMLQLVERASRLLSDAWFALVKAMIEATDDEDLKQALSERLESLQAIRQALEQSAVAASSIAEAVLAFANANWTTRRELLADPQTPLLSEAVEPIFGRLLTIYEEDAPRQALAEVRTLLRRCRTWGVDATWHFELHMRLGDSIEIPAEHEATIGQIAALLAQCQHDPACIEQAIERMQALLDRLTDSDPRLSEAALLRDLADSMLALPKEHPARQLQTIEGYYREALPTYQEAGRPVSVAYLQRALGDILSEQGRYEEALEPLHQAFEAFQEWGDYRSNAAWALSAYASALESLGRSEEAIAAYAHALTLLHDTPPLLRNRAEALISARRLEEAEADLSRAVALDGNEESSYLWMRRAQLAIARGDGALGAQMLDEVLKRSPGEDVLFERTQCAGPRGEMGAARDMLHSALEKANAGDRAAMLRKWEQLRTEHPDLPAFLDP